MNRFYRLWPTLVAALLTAGCMAEGPFPSLAQRDVERQPLEEPVRTIPNVPDDPALRAGIATLVEQARRADREFESALAIADRAARAAGAPASDSWIAAQEQISRAEAARAGTMRALGDLDGLVLERSNLPTSLADQVLLNSAMSEVELIAVGQQSRLDRLRLLIAR